MCRRAQTLIISLFFLLPASCFSLTTYTLNNGLKLVVQPNHRAPVAFVSVWYRVGGSNEHNGITGVSHLLEHMMYKGTKRYGPDVLTKLISEQGGMQNAMTTPDYTMYYEAMSANQLPLVFELEADRMRNLVLKQPLFLQERKVVMEERRLRTDDNPYGFTWERFNAMAYVNSPYHHPTVGWMVDIAHLNLRDLTRWYRTWYTPNNAVIVVVGDVQPANVYALAQQYFGPMLATPLPVLKPRTEVTPLGEKQVSVNVPAKLPIVMMGYQVPVLATAKHAWKPYALVLLSAVLSSGSSSRFSRDLVRGKAIAANATTYYHLYQRYQDQFMLIGIPAEGKTITDIQKALHHEIHRVQTQLIHTKELARVKAQFIAQKVYLQDSLSVQADQIGVPMMAGLPATSANTYFAQIKAITAEQIQQVAKEYFVPNRLTIAVLHPTTLQAQPRKRAAHEVSG